MVFCCEKKRIGGNLLKNLLKSLLVGVMVVFCALPAFADNPCKNLFDISTARTLYRNGSSVQETKTSTGYSLTRSTSSANFIIVYFGTVEELKGRTFTLSYKHPSNNGGSIDLLYTMADGSNRGPSANGQPISSASAGGRDVVSLKILTPDTNGQKVFVFEDIQIEENTTATGYVPYNPLCATCDGVVRNYATATGTITQSVNPKPTNPIEPTFYTQGDMVLRKLNDTYVDTYDASTGKITRRVGVKVLNGTEEFWGETGRYYYNAMPGCKADAGVVTPRSSHFRGVSTETGWTSVRDGQFKKGSKDCTFLFVLESSATSQAFKDWLAEQYANGTPVTVYYPLANEVEEDWPATRCAPAIKIATTAYNNNAFSSVQTALNNAITNIKTVVANTITQAAAVQSLQAGKQTMPDASDTDGTCPRFRQCLLIQDTTGKPHWYPILDPVRDFVTPILATEANSGAGNDRYDKGDPELCAIADNCTNVRNEQFSTQTGIYRLLKDREWAVPWVGTEADGIVPGVAYGESRCVYNITGVSVAEPNTEVWTIIETANAANDIENKEQYSRCYCKFTEVGINNEIFPVLDDRPWVYNTNLGTAAACASDCSRRCANRAVDNHSVRQKLFL